MSFHTSSQVKSSNMFIFLYAKRLCIVTSVILDPLIVLCSCSCLRQLTATLTKSLINTVQTNLASLFYHQSGRKMSSLPGVSIGNA